MPPSIFTSSYASAGFVITVICFFLAEVIGGKIIPWTRRRGAKVQRRAVGLNTMVYVSWIIVFGVSMGFAGNSIAFLPNWIYYVGIVVMLAGTAFRQWAIAVLGRYFSGVIGVQKEQKVVESGPYRLIRHPSYTGVLIFLVGMGLAVQSWAVVLANVIIFGVVYGYRMFVEERVLVRELGADYTEYMKRTKRVIPYIG